MVTEETDLERIKNAGKVQAGLTAMRNLEFRIKSSSIHHERFK